MGSQQAFVLLTLAALAVSGCVGSRQQAAAPATDAVRATAATAPADLQLLCASQAAAQFEASPDEVLPVASAPSGENAFQVDLNLGGGSATCIVDQDGNIVSLTRV